MKAKRIFLMALCGILLMGTCMTACKPKPSHDEEPTGAPGTDTEAATESDTVEPGPGDSDYVEPVLTGPYADTIMLSNRLADGVQAYYANPARSVYRIQNQNMRLEYGISTVAPMQVTSLQNTQGGVYLENTMDVFVNMTDGRSYLASESIAAPHTNVYRMGYYYYDAHVMGQNFMGGADVQDEMVFSITKANVKGHDVEDLTVKDGVISYAVNGVDPYAYTVQGSKKGLFYHASDYNAVQFSIKTTATSGELYFIAGSASGHNPQQMVRFELPGNDEWVTYTLVLSNATDYTGKVSSLRFDVGGAGDTVQIKDIKAIKLDESAPALLLDRTFHTYSDKLNQVLHFVATEPVKDIASLGMITRIAADTVDKLIIKDAGGTHTSLDGVDFDTCEYVGFDIKGAGVLGFILLPHENSGKLEVTLADGTYTVTQSACPAGGVINADPYTTKDDFYMGHRLYTDESHTFDAFLTEAENERHPLDTFAGGQYVGYDALRGAYRYSMDGTGFNEPFFKEQNRHYTAGISVTGTETDRNVYVYTNTTYGCAENALILDENDMLLPIPVMIYKNFVGENEEPVFDPGDPSYSEVYFPLTVKAGEVTKLTVLNLYMNWGQLPLKQLSSIQYFWPYYHLSLGTTETSCISPLYGARDLWTLPDFRSMSMPYWFELPKGEGYDYQPQHTHGGYQYFLQYTDADGKYAATENYHNDIISSGPVYTDVKMDYISDDGRIKVSYNHVELPETDELRAYYEINYEVLADISIADFAKDFSFYSFEGYAGTYRKIGYLGEQNQPVQGTVNTSAEPEVIKLGSENPYVALYDLDTTANAFIKNNVNLGVIVYDSDMTIGGQKCDAGFVAVGQNGKYSLSLDLGATTLKAGDKIKLCLIISPWGFYTSKDDSNMQAIRQNTCLDGVKLSVQDGEAMEYVFVPSVKSTNGTSAEFTISGGSDNKVVRVYGFDKLTAPVVYEKIGGEWVELTLSSKDTPDSKGYAHEYDGYAVYYDRNGTYSYAFAFNMDGKDSRTFKIVCDKDFAGWEQEEQRPEQGTTGNDTPSAPPSFFDFVDASSGFAVSDVRFTAYVDFINGTGDGDGAYNSRGSNSNKGLDVIAYNGKTVDGGKLAIAGWAVAQGGIAKYVFSADGGKTWQDCTLYNRASFGTLTEGSGIADAGNAFFSGTGYDVLQHPDHIIFQGAEGTPSGVCADLAAYKGQTLDVVFAIVPNDNPSGLCIMTVITGVTVE